MAAYLMEFYTYSITYLGDGFESEKEDGIIAASSYVDAMAEICEWDLTVEEVKLRKIFGECDTLDCCERPWVSTEELKEALEEADIQLSTKSTCGRGCGGKGKGPAPSRGEGSCDEPK